jgi:hypothetical protein
LVGGALASQKRVRALDTGEINGEIGHADSSEQWRPGSEKAAAAHAKRAV